MNDLTFGVKLTGEGSTLRGEIVATHDELVRLKAAAGGTQVETSKLNTSTQQLAEQQHRAAASGKSLSESGGQVAGELLKAAAAAMAFKGIVVDSIRASNDYQAAIMGLASAARFSGEDIDATLNKATALTADGLMSTSEAALALKNLLSRGFTADQAIEMINRLKDSAAFGKQASLEFGQAVVSATEGLKNENSILVDNAGVTKNVSVMWKEYAAQIGVTVDSLTQAQKREAEYKGLMRETEGQMGNSALAADSLMGATARMNKATNDAAIAFGQALTPATTALADGLAWASENAVKPMIWGIQSIGIAAGVASGQTGVLVDFLTSPSKWSAAGIESMRKEMRSLADLGDQMATELAAKVNGAVQAPNIGKDTGARRKDVVTPDDSSAKLLENAKKFDEKIVDLHKDTFTRDYEQWVEYENKLVAAGASGAEARAAHEAALTIMLANESAKRIGESDKEKAAKEKHLAAQLQSENDYFAQVAAARGNSDSSAEAQENARFASEINNFNKRYNAAKADHDLTLAEEEGFQQARADIIAAHQNRQMKNEEGVSKFFTQLRHSDYTDAMSTAKNLTAGLATHSRSAFEINKAASTGEAIVHTYSAAMKAYDTAGGGWWGAAAAAASIAYGLAQVSAIQSTHFGGSGGSVSAPSGGGVPSQATSPGVPVSPQPQQAQEQPVQIAVYITGNVLSEDYIENTVVGKIQDIVKNKDVLLIDPRSRQASVLAK